MRNGIFSFWSTMKICRFVCIEKNYGLLFAVTALSLSSKAANRLLPSSCEPYFLMISIRSTSDSVSE